MRKLLNNPWFVTALALTAVVLVWSSLRPDNPAGRGMALSSPEAAPAAEMPLAADPALSSRDILKQLAIVKSPRDPFAVRTNTDPVNTAQTEQPDFLDTVRLTAVWTQNGATLLLVNDSIRQVGDTLGRLTIESAAQEGIWLTHWKGRTFLALGKSFTLKTPAREPRPTPDS